MTTERRLDHQGRLRAPLLTAAGVMALAAREACACPDLDSDGACDADDRCPGFADTADDDSDGVPDGCDPCHGSDADGDGACLPSDCDDNDPNKHPGQVWYPDCDGDGSFGRYGATQCDEPDGGSSLCAGDGPPVGGWRTSTAGREVDGNDNNPGLSDFETTAYWTLTGVSNVARDPDGGIWLTMGGQLAYFDDAGTPEEREDDIWTAFDYRNGLRPGGAWSIALDGKGGMWLAAGSLGAQYFDFNGTPTDRGDDLLVSFPETGGQPDNQAISVVIESEHAVWIGSSQGLYYLDHRMTVFSKGDDLVTAFTVADGLIDDSTTCIARDGDTGLWVGTKYGTSYLDHGGTPDDKDDDSWVSFTLADGLGGEIITTILVAPDGGSWVGTFAGGLSFLDDGGTPADKLDDAWTVFNGADGLVGDTVWGLAADDAGLKWIAGFSGGLLRFDDAGTPSDKSDDTWTWFSAFGDLMTTGSGGVTYSVTPVGADRAWVGVVDG